MSSHTLSTNWYDMVIQQLDQLRQDCLEIADKSKVPSDTRFEQAKLEIDKLRRLAEFPNLPEANIWLGPNGELGVTWCVSDVSFELLFADTMHVRIYTDNEQARVPLSNAPRVFKKFATQAKLFKPDLPLSFKS